DINKTKTIAVIGPNSDKLMIGGYSGVPKYKNTVLEGIREKVGGKVNILHHEGCKITIGGTWGGDEVIPSNPEDDYRSIAEAKQLAEKADIIILAIGGNEQTSREAWALNHM